MIYIVFWFSDIFPPRHLDSVLYPHHSLVPGECPRDLGSDTVFLQHLMTSLPFLGLCHSALLSGFSCPWAHVDQRKYQWWKDQSAWAAIK